MARKDRNAVFLTPQALRQVHYRSRKSLNLCARCGTEPSLQGQCCAKCRSEMAASKQKAREQGMCLDCWTEAALPGKRYCATHTEQRKAQRRDLYWIRRLKRLCTYCGKKRAYKGRTRCRAHMEQHRRYNAQLIAKNGAQIGKDKQ